MPLNRVERAPAPEKKRYRVPVGNCSVCKCRTMANSLGMAEEHTQLVLGKNGDTQQVCPGSGCRVTDFEIVW